MANNKQLKPARIEKAIDEIARRYTNNEATKAVNTITGEYLWEMDLGGRLAVAMYLPYFNTLMCGLKHGRAISTKQADDFYKKVLEEFENDILAWREEHKGCAKQLWEH